MEEVSKEVLATCESRDEAERLRASLGKFGFDVPKVSVVPEEDFPEAQEAGQRIKAALAAGVILGSLVGSWTGVTPGLLRALGFSESPHSSWMRLQATFEDALLAGSLAASGAILYHLRVVWLWIRRAGVPDKKRPCRLEARGTPKELSHLRAFFEERQAEELAHSGKRPI
jgi:hypothetical protein